MWNSLEIWGGSNTDSGSKRGVQCKMYYHVFYTLLLETYFKWIPI